MPEGLEILEQKGGLIIFHKPTGLIDEASGMSLLRSAADLRRSASSRASPC